LLTFSRSLWRERNKFPGSISFGFAVRMAVCDARSRNFIVPSTAHTLSEYLDWAMNVGTRYVGPEVSLLDHFTDGRRSQHVAFWMLLHTAKLTYGVTFCPE
jgi:hypothetical protein